MSANITKVHEQNIHTTKKRQIGFKIITQQGEVTVSIVLDLNINLRDGGLNVATPPKEEEVEWAIPEFKTGKIEFGKNVTGEKFYTMSNFKKKSSIEMDLSNSPKEIYFIKIYNEQKMRTKKIVIQ